MFVPATDCISRVNIIGTSSLYTHTNFLDRWECNIAAVKRDTGEVWKKELLESMAKAGR